MNQDTFAFLAALRSFFPKARLGSLIVLLMVWSNVIHAATPVVSIIGDDTRIEVLNRYARWSSSKVEEQGAALSAGTKKLRLVTAKLNASPIEIADVVRSSSHVVLVVNAKDGAMPVTRQNAAIAAMMGHKRPSILLSKVRDLNDNELFELVKMMSVDLLLALGCDGENADIFIDDFAKRKSAGRLQTLARIPPSANSDAPNSLSSIDADLVLAFGLGSQSDSDDRDGVKAGETLQLWVDGILSSAQVVDAEFIEEGGEWLYNQKATLKLDPPVSLSDRTGFLLVPAGRDLVITGRNRGETP